MSFKIQLILHVTTAMVIDKQIDRWTEQQTGISKSEGNSHSIKRNLCVSSRSVIPDILLFTEIFLCLHLRSLDFHSSKWASCKVLPIEYASGNIS